MRLTHMMVGDLLYWNQLILDINHIRKMAYTATSRWLNDKVLYGLTKVFQRVEHPTGDRGKCRYHNRAIRL